MQFTLIITDSEDMKSVSVEMKRTDQFKDTDSSESNAAAMMAAIIDMMNDNDSEAVEDVKKIQLQWLRYL